MAALLHGPSQQHLRPRDAVRLGGRLHRRQRHEVLRLLGVSGA